MRISRLTTREIDSIGIGNRANILERQTSRETCHFPAYVATAAQQQQAVKIQTSHRSTPSRSLLTFPTSDERTRVSGIQLACRNSSMALDFLSAAPTASWSSPAVPLWTDLREILAGVDCLERLVVHWQKIVLPVLCLTVTAGQTKHSLSEGLLLPPPFGTHNSTGMLLGAKGSTFR